MLFHSRSRKANRMSRLASQEVEQAPQLTADGLRMLFLAMFAVLNLFLPLPAWSQFNIPERTELVSDSTFGNWGPTISSDMLEAFYVSPVNQQKWDIWTARRDNVDDSWSNQQPLDIINSQGIEGSSYLSTDGLTLTFESNGLAGGFGGFDLWQTTRVSTQDPWQKPVNMGPTINTPGSEGSPAMSADGLEIIYDRGCKPSSCSATTLRRSTRSSLSDPWAAAESMSPSASEHQFGSALFPFLSEDGRSLYFSAPGEFGKYDVFVSKRVSLDAPFGPRENLGRPINTPGEDRNPWIAADGSLYYERGERFGQPVWNIVRAEAVPELSADFDDDGDVDGDDFLTWQRGKSPNPLSQSDLVDWEANYGTVASLSANSATVPEPSSTVLLMLGLLGICRSGKR